MITTVNMALRRCRLDVFEVEYCSKSLAVGDDDGDDPPRHSSQLMTDDLVCDASHVAHEASA